MQRAVVIKRTLTVTQAEINDLMLMCQLQDEHERLLRERVLRLQFRLRAGVDVEPGVDPADLGFLAGGGGGVRPPRRSRQRPSKRRNG